MSVNSVLVQAWNASLLPSGAHEGDPIQVLPETGTSPTSSPVDGDITASRPSAPVTSELPSGAGARPVWLQESVKRCLSLPSGSTENSFDSSLNTIRPFCGAAPAGATGRSAEAAASEMTRPRSTTRSNTPRATE
jgi:hypothetical protein